MKFFVDIVLMFTKIFVNVDFVLMFKTMFLTPDEYRKIDSFMLLHFGAVVKLNHYAKYLSLSLCPQLVQ